MTNLGRTPQLLRVSAYRDILNEELERFGDVCQEITGAPTDLVQVVEKEQALGLDRYAQSVALIVAVETAQLRLLSEVHGVDYARANFSFGYSLGELVALAAGGSFHMTDIVRAPLALAADCAAMAATARMGVLFSRGPALAESDVLQLCTAVTAQGHGTVGISAILSPNTYLLIGQRESVSRFNEMMGRLLPRPAHLRINSNRWPPLHTPIVRQRNVPDRSSVMLETIPGGATPACPPVFSLVTGKRSYDLRPARETLRNWTDHPQRLWDALCETLARDVSAVIHVGPEPNVIPATFTRLSENVGQQSSQRSLQGYRYRALSGIARRPWLASMLPSKASLLRAPHLKHIILEDWLLEAAPTVD